MKLEQQVTSLELSKRLKKLGVKQESAFWWVQQVDEVHIPRHLPKYVPVDSWVVIDRQGAHGQESISAFTVAELGEILPATITRQEEYIEPYDFTSQRLGDGWICFYQTIHGFRSLNGDEGLVSARTEADARARMVAYLIDSAILTVSQINGEVEKSSDTHSSSSSMGKSK